MSCPIYNLTKEEKEIVTSNRKRRIKAEEEHEEKMIKIIDSPEFKEVRAKFREALEYYYSDKCGYYLDESVYPLDDGFSELPSVKKARREFFDFKLEVTKN